MGREFIIRSMACDLGQNLRWEEGLVEGLQKGIVALLRSKFQSEGAKLARKVRLKCEPKGWRASYGSRLGHKLSTRSGRGCASGGDGLPRRLLYRAHESFRYEMHRTEEERRIPYVTSIERLSKEEGREEDRTETAQESILALLKTKSNVASANYARKVRAERESERLQTILDAMGCATALEEVRSVLR